jgi:hypothetical protein
MKHASFILAGLFLLIFSIVGVIFVRQVMEVSKRNFVLSELVFAQAGKAPMDICGANMEGAARVDSIVHVTYSGSKKSLDCAEQIYYQAAADVTQGNINE